MAVTTQTRTRPTPTSTPTLAARGAAIAVKGSTMLATIASFLRPASAPPEHLHDQLTQAQALLDQARVHQRTAEIAFDADGSPAAESALRDATEATTRAELHYQRAARLVDQQQTLAKEADQAALRRRRDQLRAELAPDALEARRAPLASKHADALLVLAGIRADRVDFERAVSREQAELSRVGDALGDPPGYIAMVPFAVPNGAVVAALGDLCSSLPFDDRIRREVELLADELDPRRKPFGYTGDSKSASAAE
jgi:hypothetical protein